MPGFSVDQVDSEESEWTLAFLQKPLPEILGRRKEIKKKEQVDPPAKEGAERS
jgi:hypothetical protein